MRRTPHLEANPEIRLSGPIRFWNALNEFRAAHPDWSIAAPRDAAVYAIPAALIKRLAADGTRRPLFTAHQATTESAFTALCDAHFAVGIVGDDFIVNTPLNPRPGMPEPECLRQYGWTPRHIALMQGLWDPIADAAHRIKGYVGWLLTEPTFLKDVAGLRADWVQFPDGFRPNPPFDRPRKQLLMPKAIDPPQYVGSQAQEFGDRIGALLDKWNLMRLAAWDLPVPQGPLVPDPLPPGSPASPRNGLRLYLPVYYALKGDDLMSDVRRIQQQVAHDLGIDSSAAGLPRHEAYVRMLDVLHLERAIKARFPSRSPTGLVARTIDAIANYLGIDADRVRKYRQAVSRCRRGHRAGVRILRVKATAHRT